MATIIQEFKEAFNVCGLVSKSRIASKDVTMKLNSLQFGFMFLTRHSQSFYSKAKVFLNIPHLFAAELYEQFSSKDVLSLYQRAVSFHLKGIL